MKIIIGSDHGGFNLKEVVKKHLIEKGIHVEDVGCFSEESVDYPNVAKDIADKYKETKADYMFAFCGTGIGISIALNKIEGVYCALIYNENSARFAKEHNNANALAMGGREISPENAKIMIDTFLSAKILMEQHARRRNEIGY